MDDGPISETELLHCSSEEAVHHRHSSM